MQKKEFVPSVKQQEFFNFVADNRAGNCNLISVAGSGKSTSIIESLAYTNPMDKILILAFNRNIIPDLKEKLANLEKRLGRKFPNVRIQTFHAFGFGALAYALRGYGVQIGDPDDHKCRNLFKRMLTEQAKADLTHRLDAEEEFILYSSFVCELVSYAKGNGVGVLCKSEPEVYHGIVDHHDMQLENENADLGKAIGYARQLMAASYKACKETGSIDFDDMLYMPLALNVRFYQQDKIYGDEQQDTNPVRREMMRRALKPRYGRLFAVGDPKQAIYGFTGASNDAMDQIAEQFNCKTLYLNVSYRCPKAIVESVKQTVPYFEVHEGNREGDTFDVNMKEALEILTDNDAILCRNVAPMVSLAFKIIAGGRACHVLGSEIGKGLVKLIHKMEASDLNHLGQRLLAWREMEIERLVALKKDKQAEGVSDRVECILVMIESLPDSARSIQGLVARIDSLFQDEENTLTLSTMHKSKGREWENVVIYMPQLCPSPWARQPWMREQEDNLWYVAQTRAINYLMLMPEVQ